VGVIEQGLARFRGLRDSPPKDLKTRGRLVQLMAVFFAQLGLKDDKPFVEALMKEKKDRTTMKQVKEQDVRSDEALLQLLERRFCEVYQARCDAVKNQERKVEALLAGFRKSDGALATKRAALEARRTDMLTFQTCARGVTGELEKLKDEEEKLFDEMEKLEDEERFQQQEMKRRKLADALRYLNDLRQDPRTSSEKGKVAGGVASMSCWNPEWSPMPKAYVAERGGYANGKNDLEHGTSKRTRRAAGKGGAAKSKKRIGFIGTTGGADERPAAAEVGDEEQEDVGDPELLGVENSDGESLGVEPKAKKRKVDREDPKLGKKKQKVLVEEVDEEDDLLADEESKSEDEKRESGKKSKRERNKKETKAEKAARKAAKAERKAERAAKRQARAAKKAAKVAGGGKMEAQGATPPKEMMSPSSVVIENEKEVLATTTAAWNEKRLHLDDEYFPPMYKKNKAIFGM